MATSSQDQDMTDKQSLLGIVGISLLSIFIVYIVFLASKKP